MLVDMFIGNADGYFHGWRPRLSRAAIQPGWMRYPKAQGKQCGLAVPNQMGRRDGPIDYAVLPKSTSISAHLRRAHELYTVGPTKLMLLYSKKGIVISRWYHAGNCCR